MMLPGSSRILKHNFINSKLAEMLLNLCTSVNSVNSSSLSFASCTSWEQVGTQNDLLGTWLVVSHVEVLLTGFWQQGNAPPQALRAQVPLDSKAQTALLSSDEATGGSKEPKLSVAVVFSCSGQTLSGISVSPMTEGSTDFTVGEHTYKAGRFLCS